MRIATWNINSVRKRVENIAQFVQSYNPDILCLQETKTVDTDFPYNNIKALGFSHIYVRGEKSYNGVAILSKIPIKLLEEQSFINKQTRHISALLPGDVELHNFYFPAGGDIPDPSINSKFDHKLKYVTATSNWLSSNRSKNDKIILLGDLNIAPGEYDVWSHKQLLNVVSHTPIEVEKFSNLISSIDFIDIVRKFTPEQEKVFSWWSYRNRDWKKSNRGRRLDHILVTNPLQNLIKKYSIPRETRDYIMPSDHVPVIVDY